jgi:hypothetical protein
LYSLGLKNSAKKVYIMKWNVREEGGGEERGEAEREREGGGEGKGRGEMIAVCNFFSVRIK